MVYNKHEYKLCKLICIPCRHVRDDRINTRPCHSLRMDGTGGQDGLEFK